MKIDGAISVTKRSSMKNGQSHLCNTTVIYENRQSIYVIKRSSMKIERAIYVTKRYKIDSHLCNKIVIYEYRQSHLWNKTIIYETRQSHLLKKTGVIFSRRSSRLCQTETSTKEDKYCLKKTASSKKRRHSHLWNTQPMYYITKPSMEAGFLYERKQSDLPT